MKQEQKNNPIVVGALLVTLMGVIGLTVVRMRDTGGPAATVTPAAASDAPAAATAADSPSVGITAVAFKPERDPFFHSRLRAAQKLDLKVSTSENIIAPGWLAPRSPLTGFAPYPVAPLSAVPTGKGSSAPSAPPLQDAHAAAASPASDPEVEGMRALRLTAILTGAEPKAIVEGAGSSAQTVRVGDRIGGLSVAAIHTNEIVLRGAQGYWTLPLQTNETATSPDGAQPQREEPDHGGL